ncbi:MAG: hypothetical protein GXP55_10800 [Deltaproteobacteria bacterium]|nr:hypothetical protein [Deltaproteobacteria bacterium]
MHVSATSQPPADGRHVVDDDLKPFVGQLAELPVHVSARSQPPADGRHVVDDDLKPFVGHAAELPVHISATSQPPPDARHCVDDDLNPFPGQFAELPVQVSATSHGPPDARHSVDDERYPFGGQFAELPVHLSATSQPPPDARHWVDDDLNPFVGHAAELPVHISATSQPPPDARHWVEDDLKPLAGQAAELPVQVAATSHGPAGGRHSSVFGRKASWAQVGVPLLHSTTPLSHGAPVSQAAPHSRAVHAPRTQKGLDASMHWSLALHSVHDPSVSLQTMGAAQGSLLLGSHVPSAQASGPLQKTPSSQEPVFGACSQPVDVHRSSVQGLPSLQLAVSHVGPESPMAESTLASGCAPPSGLAPERGRAQDATKIKASANAVRRDVDQESKVIMEASPAV